MFVCLWQHQYFPSVSRHGPLFNMTRFVQRCFQLFLDTFLGLLTKKRSLNMTLIPFFFFLQQGHRQDFLNETFWLMTFFESASLIGSQVIGNWLVGSNLEKGIASPSSAAISLAIAGIICMFRDYDGTPQTVTFKDYKVSFYTYILGGKNFVVSLMI